MDENKLINEADHMSSLFLKKLTGRLSAEEQRELDAWTKGHARRREYAELLANAQFLKEERERLQKIDHQRAMHQMAQRIREAEKQQVGRRLQHYAVAAAVAMLLVAGAATLWYRDYTRVIPPELTAEVQQAMQQATEIQKNEATVEPLKASEARSISHQYARTNAPVGMKEELLAAKKITTRSDKEFWVTLSDGTLVHLNYNTRLIYPEQFIGDTRDVVLEGDAYFMVAKDRRHPFIVHTDDGSVKVYGTEFVVETQDTELNGTNVILVKGSVSATPNGGQEQMMQPGQKCSMVNEQCAIEEVDVEPYVAWNQGTYAFSDVTLEHVMKVIAKWYGFEPVFASDDLREQRIIGDFDRYESADNILSVIAKATGLQIVKDGEQVVFKHRDY